jgi:hypothetical protein
MIDYIELDGAALVIISFMAFCITVSLIAIFG